MTVAQRKIKSKIFEGYSNQKLVGSVEALLWMTSAHIRPQHYPVKKTQKKAYAG